MLGPMDPDLLDEVSGGGDGLRAAARAVLSAARLPLRVDRPTALRLATRAPLGAARVAAGRSAIAPARGDRRFEAEAWRSNGAFRRLVQAYLGVGAAVDELVDAADLDWRSERRARLVADNIVQAIAPTNFLATNPEALKRVIDTRGRSVLTG